jgi:predicted DNA-binding ArsR family transcriptional regulator
MYYELSKREKKIARACIDKGLDAEFREGLEKIEAIISGWRNGEFAGNKEAYHEMYRGLDKKNRAIAKRYDGLSGSRWLVTVADILRDGYISEEDIKDFSEETKALIKRWTSAGDIE